MYLCRCMAILVNIPTMDKYAIIVAGGTGERMAADKPKQFLTIHQKPILMHTLHAFYLADAAIQLLLVLPEAHLETWKTLCEVYAFNIPHEVVKGGALRFNSVLNGLNAIGENSHALVAIHDGVRPLIETNIINEAYAVAAERGNAIVAVKSKDSLRHLVNGENKAVNRDEFYMVQTPQTFQLVLIKEAYRKATHQQFTDDAAVLEANGATINLTEGSYRNIKITTPEDLVTASAFLK